VTSSFPAARPGWAWAAHLLGVILVILGVLALTFVYVSAEHTFYTWDFHEYTTRLETTYAALTQSPLTAFVQVYLSTSQEYGLIPTIPLLPLRLILGGSRMAFELDAAGVFIVPFVLTVGWIGSRTIPGPRAVVFWGAVLIALAIPYTWVATLRGFVDLGAATLVALAIGLYVGDPRLTRLWRPIVIGVLLAAAFLFRRPFAYDIVAFGAAATLLALGRAALNARGDGAQSALRSLGGDVLRLGLIAASALVVLVGIGHRLLGRLLLEDYGALYQSYIRDAANVIGWLGSGYGWLIVLLAIAGFVGALRITRDARLLFVAVYGTVLTVIWVFVVGQEDVHYAAHFVVPIAIGLAAFAWTLWRVAPANLARPAMAALALLLVINLAAGLSNLVPGSGTAVRTLLAVANPPLVRTDYDEMIRLVSDLRRIAGTTNPVLVIGSTDGFSDDTIVVADDLNRGDAPPLFVLTSPHVDSRDRYPLAVLLAARVVVLPDPLPLPLAADKQGVQRVLHDLFASPSSTGEAFRPLAESYVLEDGTRVRLFERTRPTTLKEAEAALASMREYTPTIPGGQEPWISVGGLASPVRLASGDRPPIIEAGRDADGQWVANALIFIGAGRATTIDGSAEFLDRTCAGIVLRVSSIGGTLAAGGDRQVDLAPGGATSFQVGGLDDGARDLLFAPEQLDPARPCIARITLADEAGDRAGAKSLLLDDAQSDGRP
jgi:hypothetical protein